MYRLHEILQSPHFPKPHRSPKILKAIALLRRIIPPRKYPSPSFHGAASIPCNLGSHQSPATWIRINRPNHLNMILPLHPFRYQTAPLVPRSAECLQGTKAMPLQGEPFPRGAVPKPNHSKTKPFQNKTPPLSGSAALRRESFPRVNRTTPHHSMSPGNPFKSSFLCHSSHWNGRHSTRLLS